MQIKLQIKRRNRQRGQGMVEFALAFPVFFNRSGNLQSAGR